MAVAKFVIDSAAEFVTAVEEMGWHVQVKDVFSYIIFFIESYLKFIKLMYISTIFMSFWFYFS